MTQAVLKITGKVFPCRTTLRMTDAEINSETDKSWHKKFDDEIIRVYGDSMSVPEPVCKPYDLGLPYFLYYEAAETVHNIDEYPVDKISKAVFGTSFTDLLMHAKVFLLRREELQSVKVKGQTKYHNENLIGTYDKNPPLNLMLYDAELFDVSIKQYSANFIANNMYSQFYQGGFYQTLLE